jgi:hypothetical protein
MLQVGIVWVFYNASNVDCVDHLRRGWSLVILNSRERYTNSFKVDWLLWDSFWVGFAMWFIESYFSRVENKGCFGEEMGFGGKPTSFPRKV